MKTFLPELVITLAVLNMIASKLIDFEDIGAKPNDHSYKTALANGKLFNATLNALQPGDTFLVPNKTYTITGGMKARGLKNVTMKIEGTISFDNDRKTWPKNQFGNSEECIYLEDIEDFVMTSSGKGTIDGNGKAWWGAIQYLIHGRDRPRLVHIKGSKNVLVENMLFRNSPRWTFYAEKSDGLLIRYSDVTARWTKQDTHTILDLQAFNTDGFDVTGRNVHIHDSNIWCQDDCVSVKDGSEDMLFERITCSGLGLVIGSIGSSRVNNITFRDSYLPNTFKGIYMKNRWNDLGAVGEAASISNILYENITMDKPEQYAIWIGPAQQIGQPCSLLWGMTRFAKCKISGHQTWSNITLRNILINDPLHSPGVIFGNKTNPIHNLTLDNVVVKNSGSYPWGKGKYYCEGVEGLATGGTNPVPSCFNKLYLE